MAFNDDGIGAASGLEVEGHFGEGIIAEKRRKNVRPLSRLRGTEAPLRNSIARTAAALDWRGRVIARMDYLKGYY
jgi:hypothetical protein